MTKEDAEQIILKLEEEKEKIVIDEIQTEEREKTYDNIFLDFPAVTSLNDLDIITYKIHINLNNNTVCL